MSKILIGIDPDIDKNGVAILSENLKIVHNMTFWELYDFLKTDNETTTVYIEAGWLNKGNWHLNRKMSLSIAAETGRRTGLNHAVGKLIEEMCIYLEIKYKLVRPSETKRNAIYFGKITGIKYRTNQEQRDAMMLIWGLKIK